MAIKRNTDGTINMNEFENHLKASSRQEGYLEIIMFTPDPNVRLNSITSDDKLDICNIDSVGDIRKYTNITVATLEENLWLLNSRFPVYQNGKVDGYISNSMSNSNGEFITNPKMTIQLSSSAEAENFSVILNPAVPTGYPKTIKLYCYDKDNNQIGVFTKDLIWTEDSGETDEEGNILYITKTLDTLPSVNFELNLSNLYKVECEFIGTRFGNRRIRVSSIMFGKTIYLNQDQVLNVEFTDKTSFVPDTLPSRTFSFDLNNYDSAYNVDNPNNGYLSLDKQTRVQFRIGYNVAGYVYNEDGTVKFDSINNLPIVNNEEGLEEIEWDDWKELRLTNVSANADESVTFECGSILDVMTETYTQEVFEGANRTVEYITNNVLSFEGLDEGTVEWSSDDNSKSYKDYQINTVLPEVSCREIIQRLAFSIGATILIKDNGKIKFANLNLNKPESFTHNFVWDYKDFESIPAAEQLESISDISELSMPKYYSTLKQDGDVSYQGHENQTIITTVQCTSISQEVTYSECLANAARISEKDTSGATLRDDYHLYARRGIINLAGLATGQTASVDIIGYPIETKTIQERNVTSDSLVLETDLLKEDPGNKIKAKYAEWYKKKFKYNITTRGEPLVDAGDYGIIQTQFSERMPVYILQNHWSFDGTWSGDMEVIALG